MFISVCIYPSVTLSQPSHCLIKLADMRKCVDAWMGSAAKFEGIAPILEFMQYIHVMIMQNLPNIAQYCLILPNIANIDEYCPILPNKYYPILPNIA